MTQQQPFFQNSLQHLLAELARLDLFLHVQMWRVRHLQPDENDLLHHYIPDHEANARLANPPGRPLWATVTLPEDFSQDVQASLDAMQQHIAALKAHSVAQGVKLRLDTLVNQFQLHPFERDVILLCLAPALDLGYLRLYAYLQDDSNQPYPTVSLMLNLLCPTVESRVACQSMLSHGARLLRQQIVRATPPPGGGAAPTLAYQLRLDDRIYHYLLGNDTPDPELASYATLHTEPVALADMPLAGHLRERLQLLATTQTAQLFYFQGVAGVGREKTAVSLATLRQQPLLTIHSQQLLAAPPEQLPALIQRLLREAILQNALLYWANFDAFLGANKDQPRRILLDALANQPHLIILAGESD